MTLSAVVLAGESAPVTQWPQRLLGVAVMLAILAGLYLLLWRGWRRRAASQRDLPPPAATPADLPDDDELVAAEGSYVTTTRAGDWLDRVVAHGLGVRGPARMVVGWAGVRWERDGAPEVFVPAAALRGVRLERGMAGKFVEEGGLVVVTWDASATSGEPPAAKLPLDTGFRPREAARRDELRAAVELVLRTQAGTSAGTTTTGGDR